MDHVALPEAESALAADAGTLGRNFMGYTVKHASDLVACGVSGIGEVGGAFFQNRRKLIEYENAIDAGNLAVDRGYILSDDDKLRRRVIAELMCSFRTDLGDIRTTATPVGDGWYKIKGNKIFISFGDHDSYNFV